MIITIRNVRAEDLPAVADIKIKGWQAAYRGIVDDDYLDGLSDAYDRTLQKLENSYTTNGFIVAEADGEILGFCRYSSLPEGEKADCELRAIYVKPAFKHQGVGTKLFERVTREFQQSGRTRMCLWVFKENETARRFYEKMGGQVRASDFLSVGGKTCPIVQYVYEL